MANDKNNKEDQPRLDMYLACQPVFTRHQTVEAVEILFRQLDGRSGTSMSELESTLAVVLGTYSHIFRGGKIRSVPVFLPLPRELLLQPDLPSLPRNQYILEINGEGEVTPELVDRLGELAAKGYRLALYDPDPTREALRPLLPFIHVVKVEVRHLDSDALAQTIATLKRHGLDVLAHGIDSQETFRACVALDFRYFQGNFLANPTPVPGRKLSNNKQLLLRLLVELQNPNVTTTRLEQLVIQDVNLTYRILRIVNSAALGIGKTVESLSHAFALLGTEEIKRWANLLLIDKTNDKPEQLTRNMLIRGRMCELLAQLLGRPSPTDHFITGLLSQLDVLTDISMADLMSQVPLGQPIKKALLLRQGELGEILCEVEAYERGEFNALTLLRDKALYEVSYRHSTSWATRIQLSMGG